MFFDKSNFDPSRDITPLTGKIILVTGANSGLGRQSVLELARHAPACIWLAARSLEKASSTAKEISQEVPGSHIKPLALDLNSFASVQAAAKTVLRDTDRLDILMLNAGIMAAKPGLTENGYDNQMGVNHLGHALLTTMLLPLLERTCDRHQSDVRIVSLSSEGHRSVDPNVGLRLDLAKSTGGILGPYERYFQSKLANALWVKHMAKTHPRLTFVAVHPGVVGTNLMDSSSGSSFALRMVTKLFMGALDSVEKGTKNQLWAATSPQVVSGEYYNPVGVTGGASELAMKQELAKELGEWTDEQLREWL